MSIEVINWPYSIGDILKASNVLNKYGIGMTYNRRYDYFIFIEPRLLCKVQKLMFIGWVAKPNRETL